LLYLCSVGIILFDNTPCQFTFRFIIIINYYTGTDVLVLWLLAMLLHSCMLGTDGCALVTSLTRGRHCRAVATQTTAAACRRSGVLLSRAHPNLWLLILCRAHGCTITAVGEGRVVAEIREKRLLIRFRWLNSLLWDDWLFAPLRRMLVCSEWLPSHATQPPGCPLCLTVERSMSQRWDEWRPVYCRSLRDTVL